MTPRSASPAPLRYGLRPAPSPIGRSELSEHRLGETLRAAILDEVTRFLLDDVSAGAAQSEWAANLWLSAVAFGAALSAEFLHGLCTGLGDRIFTDDGSVWLEYDAPSGLRRWVADPITASLILAFKDTQGDAETKIILSDVDRFVGRILRRLSALSDQAQNDRQRRSLLADAITTYFRRFMPGVLLAHATGHTQSTAVPRSTLVRETGARLAANDDLGRVADSVLPAPSGKALTKPVAEALRPLKLAIARFQPSSRAGGKATGAKETRRGGLDATIAAMEHRKDLPPTIEGVVGGWLRWLIKHGPQKQDLETSTIQEYANTVFAFASTAVGQRILHSEVEEVEGGLRNIIETGSASGIQKRVTALRHFYHFLVMTFQVEDVEWAEVLEGLPNVISRVDANLVYWHEVVLADELIQAAAHLPESIRLGARVALHLMWPTGVRFGEAYRGRVIDYADDLSHVFVRPTEHGNTKSLRGIRVVPLVPILGDVGRGVLKDALVRAMSFGKGDRLTPLMGDPLDPRALLPRRQISALLGEALRLATGDPNVRAHHMRHAQGTRLHDVLVLSSGRIHHPVNADAIQVGLLGTLGQSRRNLHAVAQLMGQGSPDVTTKVYAHHAEFRISRSLVGHLPDLSVRHLAALTGRTPNWIYKRRDSQAEALLRQELILRAHKLSQLNFREGIATTNLMPLPPTATAALKSCASLSELNLMLRLHAAVELPTSTLGSLASVTPSHAAALIESAAVVADRHGYRRQASIYSGQWTGAAKQYEGVKRAAAGFETLPALKLLDALPVTPSRLQAASTVLRKHVRDCRAFHAANIEELEHIIYWLAACQLRAHDVDIRCPSLDGDIPPSVRRACASLVSARIGTKPPSKRGKSEVEVHLIGDDTWHVPALIHATYLWLVRSEAIAGGHAGRLETFTPMEQNMQLNPTEVRDRSGGQSHV